MQTSHGHGSVLITADGCGGGGGGSGSSGGCGGGGDDGAGSVGGRGRSAATDGTSVRRGAAWYSCRRSVRLPLLTRHNHRREAPRGRQAGTSEGARGSR